MLKYAVVGLGRVGYEMFSRMYEHSQDNKGCFEVIGIDTSLLRVQELLKKHPGCIFENYERLNDCSTIFVCVPTPVNDNVPDMSFVEKAFDKIIENTTTSTNVIHIVIVSTVAPDCIENLKQRINNTTVRYKLYYSPERYNPGELIQDEYRVLSYSHEGEYPNSVRPLLLTSMFGGEFVCVKDAKTASYVKLLENVQRDVNIALMNEFAKICNADGVNFFEVLAAASTKRSFAKFTSGLVGGHCIGTDTVYFLDYLDRHHIKFTDDIISKSREINENMINDVAVDILNVCRNSNFKKVYVLGLTYKEDIVDIRNSGSYKLVEFLREIDMAHQLGIEICPYDPYIQEFATMSLVELEQTMYAENALFVVAVPHKKIVDLAVGYLDSTISQRFYFVKPDSYTLKQLSKWNRMSYVRGYGIGTHNK